MRRLSQKRLLRLASLILTGLTVVFGILWVVRGLRPAIACGVLDYLESGDWSVALACVDQADYEALLFVVALAASFVTWLASRRASDAPRGEYHPTPIEQTRNRKGMIDRVWAIWIKGHLDQTLYQAVLMSLGMTLRPSAPRPGSVRLRRAGEQERPVPEHVSTAQLFDQAGHTLLILGEPGSGKTTMMLDLARSLLERAREDESTPIPVVFNLSSLTDPEQSLDDWLVSEIRSNYQVPEKVARYWLAHNELALLLDGLDEVRADRRAGVVKKIDPYRAQHMDPWLVICCRQNEYAELVADEAAVEGVDAVVLQPLTQMQIRGYLADLTGHEPQRLWRALQDDDVLLELADTPLMLNVMLMAAEQLDWSALPSGKGLEAVRSYIYDAYIRNVLARPRDTGRRYPDKKTLRWLQWLSRKMVAHDRSMYLLERTNRDWFNRPWQRHIWFAAFVLISGLLSWFIYVSPFLMLGLILQEFDLMYALAYGLPYGLVFGVIFGLIFGLSDTVVNEQIQLTFNRDKLLGGLILGLKRGLIYGSIGGVLFALTLGLLSVLTLSQSTELVVASMFGLGLGVIVGLTLGLASVSTSVLVEMSTALEKNYLVSRPNAAIRRTIRNGLIGALIGGVTALFAIVLGVLITGSSILLLGVMNTVVLSAVIFFGFYFGFATVIKHYTLRLLLFLDGSMPLNYVRFLDYCVDRVLLRRVGGGYVFIHRTMMEHIAGLDLEKWKEQPDSS